MRAEEREAARILSAARRARRSRHARAARAPRRGARRTVLAAIRDLPNYLRLLGGLLTDARVSTVDKVLVAGAIAYIVIPVDLIPDVIPFFGQVDDVYFLILALQRLISGAGARVVVDHWRGDPRSLTPRHLKEVLLAASFFLPRRIRRRLRRAGR